MWGAPTHNAIPPIPRYPATPLSSYPDIQLPRYPATPLSRERGSQIPRYPATPLSSYPAIQPSRYPATALSRQPAIQLPRYSATLISSYPDIQIPRHLNWSSDISSSSIPDELVSISEEPPSPPCHLHSHTSERFSLLCLRNPQLFPSFHHHLLWNERNSKVYSNAI